MIHNRVGFEPYEINYLIEHKNINVEILSKKLNKSKEDILFLKKSLGLKQQHRHAWSDKEIQYLKENYNRANIEKLSIKLNRSTSSISHKAQRLQLTGEKQLVRNPYAQDWSKEEEQYLIDNKKKSIEELAKDLNRSKNSVLAKFTRLGLRKPRHKFWTEKEDRYLEENISAKTYKQMAKKLKRTPRSCAARAKRIGLDGYDKEYSSSDIARSFNTARANVLTTWIRHNGLPAEKKEKGKQVYYSIKGEDFWKWYEQHKELVPILTYEFGSILPEPNYIRKLERR